jgi:hypothetical protein
LIAGREDSIHKYGAAAGVIAGRRRGRGRAAHNVAVEQVEEIAASMEEATEEEFEDFEKAFGVCPEAEEYTVKH